jgi:hypothetical protein
MPTIRQQKRAAQKRYRLFTEHVRDGVSYAVLARKRHVKTGTVRNRVVEFFDDMSSPGRKYLYRGFKLT